MRNCFAILLLSLISLPLFANPIQYLRTQYYADDYLLERQTNYEHPACQKFSVEEKSQYYLKCQNRQLTPHDNMDQFLDDIGAVKTKFSEDDFLVHLKDHVTRQLSDNLSKMFQLKLCIDGKKDIQDCEQAKKNILTVLKRDLPRMRALMAQMNMPGTIYSPVKPQRFQNEIYHPISGVKPKDLTPTEVEFLRGHTDDLEEAFKQEVYNGGEVVGLSGLHNCLIRREHGQKLLLKTDECERFKPIVGHRANLMFDRQNKKYKEQYNSIISQNPMLTLLSVTGQESDEDILTDVSKTLEKLLFNAATAMKHAVSLNGDDRIELMAYKNAVNQMLSSKEPSRIQCDLAHKLGSDREFDETMTDVYIGVGAVIGGGLCAFTNVAFFGCSVGVGLGTEAVALYVAQERHEKSQSAFFSGLGDADLTLENEFSRNLSLYLLPLSVASEGVVRAVKLAKNVPPASVTPPATTAAPTSAIETTSKRYDIRTRREVDELDAELGTNRRILLIKYNPGNKHKLSRTDLTYFSGIADILEKRMAKMYPNLSSDALAKRVQLKLGEIIRRCKASK